MLFNVFLVADSGDEADFLIRKSLSALFKHVGVADVERIEDTVGINPEDFLLWHLFIIIDLSILFSYSS